MDAIELSIGPAGQVRRCWEELVQRAGRAGPDAAAVLDQVIAAYGEPHRHYHTLDHIAALLALLDDHTEGPKRLEGHDRSALTAAILFHDIVYDPQRHDNEEASAALASKSLGDLGFPESFIAKVERCIRATRHGRSSAGDADADIALLLDLDLSILAAPPDAYGTYTRDVRQEYAHVPDTLYRLGRRRVLNDFLARERIYLTPRLAELWEAPARANITAEVAELLRS